MKAFIKINGLSGVIIAKLDKDLPKQTHFLDDRFRLCRVEKRLHIDSTETESLKVVAIVNSIINEPLIADDPDSIIDPVFGA